jgi:transposase
MLTLRYGTKLFLSLDAIDMRKSINGLCAMITDYFKEKPSSGNIFLFCSANRRRVKILFFDRNGFVVYYKRLERGRFRFKIARDGVAEITGAQLQWLLAGLDFQLMQEFSELDYTNFY